MKVEPDLVAKQASLDLMNIERMDKVYEEGQYTRTLNYMIQREKTSIQFKSKRIHEIKDEIRYLDFIYTAADT